MLDGFTRLSVGFIHRVEDDDFLYFFAFDKHFFTISMRSLYPCLSSRQGIVNSLVRSFK